MQFTEKSVATPSNIHMYSLNLALCYSRLTTNTNMLSHGRFYFGHNQLFWLHGYKGFTLRSGSSVHINDVAT